jgi:DNA-binding MarR family transcriptional regulator
MTTPDRIDFLSEKWAATRPDIDTGPWRIWGRLTRIQEIFALHAGKSLKTAALTYSEFQTLGALVLAGPPYEANPHQIANFNLLTSGGLANLLGRMERDGLILRRPDAHDKRGVVVRLTELGLDRFNQAVVRENRVEHDLVQVLTPLEQTLLSLLLRKLLLGIDRA